MGKRYRGKWNNSLAYTMEETEITCSEIARRSEGKIHHSSVVRIRDGKWMPNVQDAMTIANAIGKSIEETFFNPDGILDLEDERGE